MNRKLKEAFNYMEQKYIDEAVEYKASSRNYKPLLRWGALAACLVLIVSLSFGFFADRPVVTDPTDGTTAVPTTQQPTEPAKPIVLPPVRYGEGTSHGFWAKKYSLESAVQEAEVVAWVRIGNWLGEDFDPTGRTFYEAEVIQCFKGSISDTFTLRQSGSSESTFHGHPLFTCGNELLLFMKESTLPEDALLHDNCYRILGFYNTVMDIVKDEAGTVYVSARSESFGESITAVAQNAHNLAYDTKIKNELISFAMTVDEIQSDKVAETDHLFKLDALKEYLE